MNRKYFGTDGVRGEYGASLLTDAFAYRLGKAVGRWILNTVDSPTIVIGRDTRESGPALRDALAAGFLDAGNCRIVDLGVIPTPAVAVYVRNVQASLGVVITASHNPAKDNGIKFFNSAGLKLSDDVELEIEAHIDTIKEPDTITPPFIEEAVDSSAGYLDLLQPVLPPASLSGLKIVVDTANGAAHKTTPALLLHLGAEVIVLANEPDGMNINQGVGSQYPEHLSRQVLEHHANLGIAHDGDADRILACDENGKVLDGDTLLCILALHELKKGRLNNNTLVATRQSNLGLGRALKQVGGHLVKTDIGDRYVLEEMLKSGYNLGGENSGHIIFSDINPAGDGLLSALKLFSVMVEEKKPISELRSCLELFPQKTGAILVNEKPDLEDIPEIQDTLASLKSEMGDSGRVLLRYSGTEPKIRLLIEGESAAQVNHWYQVLETQIRQSLT
ncbi:MAG: phosphoglucosamine mutase [Verrucomicrobia bacterium]|nr:phosphoglucosamine mutase [Verrucomicrobiota bacterium]MDA1068128.1 phosphoglucosamine mutase [Verrucomicrobiota bacterium]